MNACVYAGQLLRGTVRGELLPAREELRLQFLLVLLCGAGYGLCMGSYGGLGGAGWLQMIYAAIKAPLLLAATFLLCLPSFFVFNTLLGTRADFSDALQALVGAQTGLTLVLLSLAPLTVFWYVCSADHAAAILCNALMFGLASLTGQAILRRAYRPLLRRNPRHRILLRLWLLLYLFVGIQMGWVLRPFVGHPDLPVRFFREEAWGNAYVALFQILRDVLN